MGLDKRGRLIVRYGMEVVRIKEELMEVEDGVPFPEFPEQRPRSQQLEERKRELLAEVLRYAASRRRTTFPVGASE